MASIDDLKNNGNTQPFIPTIQQGGETGGFVPTIEGGETPLPPKRKGSIMGNKNVISMTSAKPKTVEQKEVRQKADFSTLPEAETPGVQLKESLEKEILGPGGMFDEYVERMQKEATEYYAEEELKKEIGDDGSDSENEEFTEVVDEEPKVTYKSNTVASGNKINPFGDNTAKEEDIKEEDNDMTNEMKPVEVVEEVIDDNSTVEYEAETPAEEVVETVDPVEEEIEKEEIKITRNVITTNAKDDDIDDELLDDDEVVSEDEDDEDAAQIEALRAAITERIKPISKRLDISGFTIASKPTLSNEIAARAEVPTAIWALPSSGICIEIKEILGSDLEKIRTYIQNNNIREAFQIIYENIVSEKPGSLEAWMKSIAFEDYDHIFFAIYIAAFTGSNYIPITCPNNECKNNFITEDIPMNQMVKFDNEEAEKKFKELLNSNVTNSKGLVPSAIIPISENYAFGFILPSLYNILIESSYIDSEFSSKHSNAVAITPYIDKIYEINAESKQLIPIGYKEFVNNKAKTIKSKIIRYDKILSVLRTDEIASIRACISNIVKDNASGVSYQIPAATCTKCGKEIPATKMEASALVFTRNQLGLLMNI